MAKRPPLLAGLLALIFSTCRLDAQCNSVPIAVNDTAEYFGRAISFEPLWNDREPDGEALELTLVGNNCTSPAAGAPLVVQVENGTLRLLPTQPGYATTCAVNYRIEDERGFTATAQVLIRETSLFSDGFESGSVGRWSPATPDGGGER